MILTRVPAPHLEKERVGVILLRCLPALVAACLVSAKPSKARSWIALSDDDRTGHLPKLVEDVALRLSQDPASTGMELAANESHSARAHGELRYLQGYTPAMLAHESRILQVTISGTLQSSLNHLDFGLLLPDVMAIADKVDSHLTQAMES